MHWQLTVDPVVSASFCERCRMDRWRLYFCDWGFSTYEEKLQAVISDRQAKIQKQLCGVGGPVELI